MPASRPERSGAWKIFVLFAAAALLAITGILLLVVDRGRAAPSAEPDTAAASPGPTSSAPSTSSAGPTPTSQDTAAAEREPSAPGAVPPEAANTARRFVLAWASHDARPGHDVSFSDAGRRAAAYATDELAAQLREPGDRSTRLWQQWLADKTRVNCVVDRVAAPDGAPAATSERAYVRLLYTCTTRAAGQPATRSHDQLAVEMHHAPAGAWRVAAIVNA
ncbi:hypothetical protein PYK79_08530 [Streptomyces sp. ID05-04B]|uniref:hypothetical protein n=1 Tax=Streptomyces sp. ID05-04B TaxID=3028661 RepID=UPI0029C1CD3E|nr:hypothetical protein [Streptomyces sp. ID05-04B]MDX5563306.1 hypothetical protein [Streptomyces sp. ID05-04B]